MRFILNSKVNLLSDGTYRKLFQVRPSGLVLPVLITVLLSSSGLISHQPVITANPEIFLPTQPIEKNNLPKESEINLDEEFIIEKSTNLEGIAVCTLLPLQEGITRTGLLRKEETEPTLSLDREVECVSHDQEGHFYEVIFYPLDQWGIEKLTLNDVDPVESILDGAFLGYYSGGKIFQKALVEGELVIGVHVRSGVQQIPASRADLAAEYRPKIKPPTNGSGVFLKHNYGGISGERYPSGGKYFQSLPTIV